MQTNYILIDFENVHVKSLSLLKDRQAQVKVFLGPKNTRIPVELVLAMQGLGEWGDYIMLEVSGPNALDFHIAYYLGKLVAQHPDGHFHIISKDTGFDSLLRHLQRKGTLCTRSPSIEMMLGVDSAETKAAEPRTAARQPRSKAEPAAGQKGRQAAPARVKNERAEKPREPVARVTPAAPAARIKEEPRAAAMTPPVQSVVANLTARGTSRPRRLKTLLSTIKSLLKLNDDDAAQIVETLQKLGKVTVAGEQVSYRI